MMPAKVIALHRGTPLPEPARPAASPWQRVRRLLAIRVDNLGDVLMTTPALAAAAESVPGLEITLLGNAGAGALAPHLPMVHEVITAKVPWVRHETGHAIDEDQALVARLAARRFDAAVIFTVCTQSALPAALLCRLAGIPLRLAHVRENPYELLSDWAPEPDIDIATARHEVRRQLDLVARVGWRTADERLRFGLLPADVASIEHLLAAHDPQDAGRRLVAVHVGASAPSRRWPAERFGQAADAIARRTGARVVFTGSADETPLIDAARAAMRPEERARSLALAGALTLGELGALLARADLLLTNNSGPAHLAAALGTPVVDLYALTNPQHTPWQVPARVLSHDVACRNCLRSRCPQGHQLCLTGVPTRAAVDAAIDLLDSSSPATGTHPISEALS